MRQTIWKAFQTEKEARKLFWKGSKTIWKAGKTKKEGFQLKKKGRKTEKEAGKKEKEAFLIFWNASFFSWNAFQSFWKV